MLRRPSTVARALFSGLGLRNREKGRGPSQPAPHSALLHELQGKAMQLLHKQEALGCSWTLLQAPECAS